jgi:hypothetical protein
MYDTAELDIDLPDGTKLTMREYELQCSIECMMARYTIKNYGNLGRTKHIPFDAFAILRNRKLYLSAGNSWGSVYNGSIVLHFNRLGVLTRFEITKYDQELKKEVVVPNQWVEWPADQIKEYNRKALKDILLFMPSRFKEGVPLGRRMWYFIRQYTYCWIRGCYSDWKWERGREARMANYTKKG